MLFKTKAKIGICTLVRKMTSFVVWNHCALRVR